MTEPSLCTPHPKRGRDKQPREDERGQSFPGGAIYVSFPGLGDRLAARALVKQASPGRGSNCEPPPARPGSSRALSVE